jgi:hypothetical protein
VIVTKHRHLLTDVKVDLSAFDDACNLMSLMINWLHKVIKNMSLNKKRTLMKKTPKMVASRLAKQIEGATQELMILE